MNRRFHVSKASEEMLNRFSIDTLRKLMHPVPVVEDFMEQLAGSETEIDLVEKLFGTDKGGDDL